MHRRYNKRKKIVVKEQAKGSKIDNINTKNWKKYIA